VGEPCRISNQSNRGLKVNTRLVTGNREVGRAGSDRREAHQLRRRTLCKEKDGTNVQGDGGLQMGKLRARQLIQPCSFDESNTQMGVSWCVL